MNAYNGTDTGVGPTSDTWTRGPVYPVLRCPRCGYDRMRASDAFCGRCAALLPEDWVAQEAERFD